MMQAHGLHSVKLPLGILLMPELVQLGTGKYRKYKIFNKFVERKCRNVVAWDIEKTESIMNLDNQIP